MATDPYNIPVSAIGGALNFGTVPAPTDYSSAYNNALNLNKQNYSNILSGYQQTAANQQTGQQSVLAGYGNLGNTIQNTIQGVDQSQRQAITDQYAMAAGKASQGLISRGLGNTTVANSVQAGLLSDKSKANIALSNQMAQLQAGYQSQIGMAGLGYAGQSVGANTQQANRQLDWMNSINSPYPNAQQYAMLAQQKGAVSAGLGGAGAFGGGRGGGGGNPMSSGSMLGGGFGNNYGGGSSAMYPTMGNRSGAYGQTYQEPLTSFGGQGEAPPDMYAMGREYAANNPMAEDQSGSDQNFYADNSFMNETPDQGGGYADSYYGNEYSDASEYY